MSLLSLPNELLIQVSSYLEAPDVNALIRSDKYLAALLSHVLQRLAASPNIFLSALFYSAIVGNREMLKFILESGPPMHISFNQEFILSRTYHEFPNQATTEFLDRIIANCFRFTCHCAWMGVSISTTPLPWAVYRGFERMVKFLLEMGSPCNGYALLPYPREWATLSQKTSYQHILHIAAARNSPVIIDLLLGHGADIKHRDELYYYAIHIAASTCSSQAVQRLLEGGADVEGPHHEEVWSPLAIAAWYGHYDTVKVLLESGADTNRQLRHWQVDRGSVRLSRSGEEGFTALHRLVARMSLNSPWLKWQDGPRGVNQTKEPWTHQWESIFRLFLEHGADPTIPDCRGRSARYLAQSYGMVEVMELLQEIYPWQDVGYEHWKAMGYEVITGRDIIKPEGYVTEEILDQKAWRAKRRSRRHEMKLSVKTGK